MKYLLTVFSLIAVIILISSPLYASEKYEKLPCPKDKIFHHFQMDKYDLVFDELNGRCRMEVTINDGVKDVFFEDEEKHEKQYKKRNYRSGGSSSTVVVKYQIEHQGELIVFSVQRKIYESNRINLDIEIIKDKKEYNFYSHDWGEGRIYYNHFDPMEKKHPTLTVRWFNADGTTRFEINKDDETGWTVDKKYEPKPFDVPQQIKDILDTECKGWSIYGMGDYIVKEYIWRGGSYVRKQNVLIADFDGNEEDDVAMQVISSSRSSPCGGVYVFLKKQDKFKAYRLDAWGDYIEIIKPQIIDLSHVEEDIEEEFIELKNPGISVVIDDRASSGYYFKDGGFKLIPDGGC